MYIEAARRRGGALDHVLIFGPPGLGKTTLSHVIANELGVNLRSTSGPVLERPGDLAALLTNLQPRDVLFVDEIHRLSPIVEEVLYPALEDFQIDIMIGEGPAARSIKLDLPPFTLVGATTRAGLLTAPLRDRFGIVQRLEFYSTAELTAIVQRAARILGIACEAQGATEIARRARGTPRIANRLLRRVRDYAEVKAGGVVTAPVAAAALDMLKSRRRRIRRARPAPAHADHREFRRRSGRRRFARGRAQRGTRHDRGRTRAVPDPAGIPDAYRTRAHGHPQGVRASGFQGAAARGRRGPVRGTGIGHREWGIGNASARDPARMTAGRRAPDRQWSRDEP